MTSAPADTPAPEPSERPAAPSTDSTPEIELPASLVILPSRDAVLYPGMLLPLQVSDERWVRAIGDAASAREPVGLFLQKQPEVEKPRLDDLHRVGTAANVVRLLKLPDGSLQVLMQGTARVALGSSVQEEPYLRAQVLALPPAAFPPTEDGSSAGMEREALIKNLQTLFQRLVQLSPNLPGEMAIAAMNVDDPGRLADFAAANADLEPAQRQAILEELDVVARVRRVSELVTRELEVLEIGSRIQSEIKESMDKSQREYYLRQQLQAIRRELGEVDEAETAVADLRERLANVGLPEEARKEADRELNRLGSVPTASPEYAMVRTYLEWLVELPWSMSTVPQAVRWIAPVGQASRQPACWQCLQTSDIMSHCTSPLWLGRGSSTSMNLTNRHDVSLKWVRFPYPPVHSGSS